MCKSTHKQEMKNQIIDVPTHITQSFIHSQNMQNSSVIQQCEHRIGQVCILCLHNVYIVTVVVLAMWIQSVPATLFWYENDEFFDKFNSI